MHFGKNTIIVLKSHPFHPDLVAYGVRNGLVFIVNISGNGKIVHKIRAHDEDIHGLDWSPSLTRDVLKDEEDSNDEGSILAVSSRDKSVSIWSLKTASKLAHLRLPMAKTNNNYNYKSEQSWITLKWFKYNLILVGGASGELCQWNLDKLSKKSPGLVVKSDGQGDEFQILHREHFKNLYSLDSYNNIIFSCGYDRSIVAFNVKANSLAFTLPAFASRIICMASNLVDPSILAIGAGDGVIRIWKTASTKAMFEVAVIYQKPTSRCEITAMAFHPKKENMLAFATEEGRIGIVDALASRPNPMFYDYKYRGSVYNLAWGPPIGDSAAGMNEKDDPNLYSLGDGFVMMHQGRAGNNVGLKSVNIEEVISKTNNWTRKSPSRSNILFQPLKAEFVAIGMWKTLKNGLNTFSYLHRIYYRFR
jgi:gem associated protein 5